MCTHKKPTRRTILSTILPAAILAKNAFPQSTPDMAERFRKMSADYEKKGLAEPFKGVTTNGTVEPGLFGLHSTGVSTGPVRVACERFLASLTKEQRDRTMFAIDDPEWRKWMNQHFYIRQGVSLKEMTEAQRTAAFGTAFGGAQRAGNEADAGHHEAERDTGGAVGRS
jgi:hypothetical protein